jgi:hypothetical protein
MEFTLLVINVVHYLVRQNQDMNAQSVVRKATSVIPLVIAMIAI